MDIPQVQYQYMAGLNTTELRDLVNQNRELITPYINPDYLLAHLWSLDNDIMWGIRRIWLEKKLFSSDTDLSERTQFRADLDKLQKIIETSQRILKGTIEPQTYLDVFDQGLLPIDMLGKFFNMDLSTTSSKRLKRLRNSLHPKNVEVSPDGPTLDQILRSFDFYIALRKEGERS